MKLNIRVDAQFHELQTVQIDRMKETFSVQEREGRDGRKIFHVWLSSSERIVDDVDAEIQNFLRNLQRCGFDEKLENTLRIAVFYKLSETIVFSFYASSKTLRLLADCGMSLETIGYPCSDDEAQ
ncbi:hypothetical protein [Paraburkholderia sediminicola]|uniref:hypothetical protein n=1 Tax=Paraburkholderia sediminicola TaxID=458836 RepID=UPI0038BC408C